MNGDDWKTKFMAIGAAAGAILGLGTAYLLIRTAEEKGASGPPEITTADAIKAGIGIVGLVRGIAALGDRHSTISKIGE